MVYDASSKEGKKSLNDCLHVGPSLTPMVYDMFLRFMENRIVLVGDIEKAFLNVEVDIVQSLKEKIVTRSDKIGHGF